MVTLRPRLSRFIEPCLPSTVPQPPSGTGWLHEIKHDGYRLMACLDGRAIRLLTRNGHDWTERFPSIAAAVFLLRCRSCLIDGEVVVCGPDGVSVFDKLRAGARVKPEAILYAFDLIEIDGRDLRRQPIEERKDALAALLLRGTMAVRLCEHIEDDGPIVFKHACRMGLEGIVSKRRGSLWRSGRTRDWLKSKNPGAPAVRREAEEDWSHR
jgi:bifunctional non-homologous end joining protein LigD